MFFLLLWLGTKSNFPDHSQTPSFQIISWSPLNTLRLDIPHCKIFTTVIQNLTEDVAYFSIKLFCFSSFHSSAHLMHTCAHPDWLYIETWKWCIEKDKTPEAAYLLKVSNKDSTGIIESCSNWKYMALFWCPYW